MGFNYKIFLMAGVLFVSAVGLSSCSNSESMKWVFMTR
jgi:hypothetical protein